MYLEHFGLKEYPFGLTPDTRFFRALPTHQDALNVLLVGLNGGEGFIKATGEVGSGKTMVCRKLLNELGPQFDTAWIPNPALSQSELLTALARELGVAPDGEAGQGQLMESIYRHLLAAAQAGRRVVLVLDEAQAIPPDSLELLRLLTNLETERSKLMQIVLFGQPELDELLSRNDLRQLRQRITFSCRLTSLGLAETRRYLSGRLQAAGYIGGELLTLPALWLIRRRSGGVPRLLNIVAHKAMLLAYGKGERRVRAAHVWIAAADTEGVRRGGARYWPIGWILLAGAGWLWLSGAWRAWT